MTTSIINTPLNKKNFGKTALNLSLLGCIGSLCAMQIACANPPSFQAVNYQNDTSIYQFNDMERAGSRGDINAMYQYEQSMQGQLFAMYPTYYRLNKDLGSQSVQTVTNFVRQYPSTVISEKLVADYAEEKARQSDYASVRAVSNLIENADASESCAIGLGYNDARDGRLATQKDDVWLNTQIKQSLCTKLASEMVHNPTISRTDKHEQLIRMMRIDSRKLNSRDTPLDRTTDIVNLARQLNLPIDYGTLSTIRANPNGFFGQFAAQPFNEVNQYLYVYAISQMAHRSYSDAAMQLNYDINADNARPQKLLSDMARRYAWRSIAVKRMNMNTDDGFSMDAVTWFRNSLGEPFNFEEAEDYAQAAIYFSQWQDVERAINAMNAKSKNEAAWRYWLARSLEMQGKQNQARPIYQSIAGSLNYYGLLAKDRLGQRLSLQDIGGNALPNLSNNDYTKLMQDQYFARAIKLMENGAGAIHIQREWNWAVRKANNAGNHNLILIASRRAHDLGYHDRVIQAFDIANQLKNAALSHPMPYLNYYQTYSQNVAIEPAWALGITRQESRFVTNARSGANAAGLMQIIPGTANQIARGLGERAGNMNDPATNIRYGTWFLSDLYRKTGNIAVATASYNAGPNASVKWLPKHAAISADQFVEAIPYSETRDYVKNVMANTTVYGVLLGNPMSISQRMGMVQVRW